MNFCFNMGMLRCFSVEFSGEYPCLPRIIRPGPLGQLTF
jgi:hypothetical protein